MLKMLSWELLAWCSDPKAEGWPVEILLLSPSLTPCHVPWPWLPALGIWPWPSRPLLLPSSLSYRWYTTLSLLFCCCCCFSLGFVPIYFIFCPHCVACGDLSSLIRDWTCVPGIGSLESEPLDHQGSPSSLFFRCFSCVVHSPERNYELPEGRG